MYYTTGISSKSQTICYFLHYKNILSSTLEDFFLLLFWGCEASISWATLWPGIYFLAYIATLTCNFSGTYNILKLLHCVYLNTDMQLLSCWKKMEITALRILQHLNVAFLQMEISGNYCIACLAILTCNFSRTFNILKLPHCINWNTDILLLSCWKYMEITSVYCNTEMQLLFKYKYLDITALYILQHATCNMQLFQNVLSLETTALRILEQWHAASITLRINEKYCIAYFATLKCSFSSNEYIWILLQCIYCNTDMQLFPNLKYL